MKRLEILEMCEGSPTRYENLYFHKSSVFEYVYVDDEFTVEARNCRDLKFKLSLKGITLVERQVVELSSETPEISEGAGDFVQASKLPDIEVPYVRTSRLNNTSFRPYGVSSRELELRNTIANKY